MISRNSGTSRNALLKAIIMSVASEVETAQSDERERPEARKRNRPWTLTRAILGAMMISALTHRNQS